MTISTEELEFFDRVAHAAFANPFTEERHGYDLEIAGLQPSTPRPEVIDAMIEALRQRLDGLRPIRLDDYESRAREVVEHALLFELFHAYSNAFDAHIAAQLEHPGGPIPVEFAGELFDRLIAYGFARARATRILCMFFQLRRAFYFISNTLTGHSPSMKTLKARLWDTLFTSDFQLYERELWNRMHDFSVLILGDTGTGKGTAAAALGLSGWVDWDDDTARFKHAFQSAFVPVNVSQFPPTLIESELFGHRKGAFTGAIDAHAGVFERCPTHGVIFLDEIGEIEESIQVKLLRVLQERTFSPVGDRNVARFDGRVIAATNRSIENLRAEGRFRDDLYYRLCSDIIVVPTLHERVSEDPAEFEVLIQSLCQGITGADPPQLVERVLDVIGRLPDGYAWPGNVRELEQCIRRVVIRGDYSGDRVATADPYQRIVDGMRAGTLEVREVSAAYCQLLYERVGTYEEVGRIAGVDRRTAKRYIQESSQL